MRKYRGRTHYFLNLEGFEAEFREMLRVGTKYKEIREHYNMSYEVLRNLLQIYINMPHMPCRNKQTN